MDAKLNAAIHRLAAFRACWKPGERIDDDIRLMADDLDLILAALGWEVEEPRTLALQRVGGE